jgi:hypothetical protein
LLESFEDVLLCDFGGGWHVNFETFEAGHRYFREF